MFSINHMKYYYISRFVSPMIIYSASRYGEKISSDKNLPICVQNLPYFCFVPLYDKSLDNLQIKKKEI